MFIIFLTFSNIGGCGKFNKLDLSPRDVSVTGFNNVSLKCLVEERLDSCSNNELLQWRFFRMPLKSGEKYEIKERKTKTKWKRVSMITIFNIGYNDEGKYYCRYSCKNGNAIGTVSLMKVLSGMNNCVIISSAFSKGIRVGEILRYKEEGGKKINAEKMQINDR